MTSAEQPSRPPGPPHIGDPHTGDQHPGERRPGERDTGEQVDELLAQAAGRLGAPAEPQNAADYLELISASQGLEARTRRLLHGAVTSARSAGVTWAAVGKALGISKQAAQKRFALAEFPPASDLNADERLLGPVTAFDEMAELDLAGRYGWHSVAFGPFYHRVVRSPTQWEHRRISWLRSRVGALRAEGWQVIGSEFPFVYLKRALSAPAEVEPGQPS